MIGGHITHIVFRDHHLSLVTFIYHNNYLTALTVARGHTEVYIKRDWEVMPRVRLAAIFVRNTCTHPIDQSYWDFAALL